jgi:hypothetical protein
MQLFPHTKYELFAHVFQFSIYAFPFTLISAFGTGLLDGLFRFKSLAPPFLRLKIIFSSSLVVLASAMFFVGKDGNNVIITMLLSFGCMYFAVRLGLLGKKLLNVILPGSYPVKKPKIPAKPDKDESGKMG